MSLGARPDAGTGSTIRWCLERVGHRSRTLRDMTYIPTLVASLDARLDELATEMSALEDARASLRTRTLAPLPPTTTKRARSRRPARQAKKTAATLRSSATNSEPVASMTVAGSRSVASEPRRRASAKTTARRRPASSLSAEQLERLLGDTSSGLSAGAIAEQAGVGYSRLLAQLRELEASGKVRRTGARRSTHWLLITEEDRIAQRTAELERLVGARRDDRTQRRGRARAS
jgi:hypothetical protein